MRATVQRRYRVAVIEDDPQALRVLQTLLDMAGYEVEGFGSAEALLEAWREKRFDLLVSDVLLPGRSGLDLLKGLRQAGHDVPVLLISSLDSEEVMLDGLLSGAGDYLVKPFQPAVLRAKVRHLLSGSELDRLPPERTGEERLRDLPEPPAEFAGLRLERELGRGAHGVVYVARCPQEGRVAVKLLQPSAGQEPEWVSRYLREVGILSSLEVPHVVRFIRAGRWRGVRYLVMELVEGRSLMDRVAKEGPLSVDEALDLAEQLITAVESLHQAGLVHRDIKPANILLGPDGQATLVDFGLAKFQGDTSLTGSRDLIGTPSFLAPELIRGDRQAWLGSDVYAIGAVLYRALTGRLPHYRATPYDSLKAAANAEKPPSVREVKPGLPLVVDHLVANLLHPQLDKRVIDPRRIRLQLDVARSRPK